MMLLADQATSGKVISALSYLFLSLSVCCLCVTSLQHVRCQTAWFSSKSCADKPRSRCFKVTKSTLSFGLQRPEISHSIHVLSYGLLVLTLYFCYQSIFRLAFKRDIKVSLSFLCRWFFAGKLQSPSRSPSYCSQQSVMYDNGMNCEEVEKTITVPPTSICVIHCHQL